MASISDWLRENLGAIVSTFVPEGAAKVIIGLPLLIAASVGVLVALGFAATWVFKLIGPEFFKQRLAARISFEQSIAERIAKLATEHYWSLSGSSASLSVRLHEHLATVESHALLYAHRPGRGFLASRANTLARDAARQSLPDLCRLIFLINRFQFVEGNAYLLVSDDAGRNCTRLHNRFTQALDAQKDPSFAIMQVIETLDREFEKNRKQGRNDKPGDATLRWDLIDETFCSSNFPEQLRAWETRLRWNLDKVAVIAVSLRTYSEVLDQELQRLFADWFDSRSAGKGGLEDQVRRISPSGLLELRQIAHQPALARSFEAVANPDLPPLSRVERPSHPKAGTPQATREDAPNPIRDRPPPPPGPRSPGETPPPEEQGAEAAMGRRRGPR